MSISRASRLNILVPVAFVAIVLLLVGAIFLQFYTVTIQPRVSNRSVVVPIEGCAKDLLVCTDGTTRQRIPPSCEFAPCPDGTNTRDGNGGTVSIVPIQPEDSPMSMVADLPINNVPATAQSVMYVVEHRSALNEKQVTVTGVIVENNLDVNECPEGEYCAMMYVQPNIVIADSISPDRNTLYDLRVNMLPEAEEQAMDYPVGTIVTLTGTVSGSLEGVIMSY